MLNAQRLRSLKATVNLRPIQAILDTGATVSVVSKKLVPDELIQRTHAIPVQVASGEVIYTMGTTILTIEFDQTIFHQQAHVLDTQALDAVLGLDFLSNNPRCGGILTQPPPERLLFDGKVFPLSRTDPNNSVTSFFRIVRKALKTESYKVIEPIRNKALETLDIKDPFVCDLFANHCNTQEKDYCTRKNSAFFYNWSQLVGAHGVLWANPPFSQLNRVLTKIVLEPTRIVLVAPEWNGLPWQRLLQKLATKQFVVTQGEPLYVCDWHEKPLPSPQWNTVISYIDTTNFNVDPKEPDKDIVKWISKVRRQWGRDDLHKQMQDQKLYPLTFSVALEGKAMPSSQVVSPKVEKNEVMHRSQSCPPQVNRSIDLDLDIPWLMNVSSHATVPSKEMNEFSVELLSEVDIDHMIDEVDDQGIHVPQKPIMHEPHETLLNLWHDSDSDVEEGSTEDPHPSLFLAKATAKFPIGDSQIEEMAKLLYQNLEASTMSKQPNPFTFESQNIEGNFEENLSKVKASPQVKALIRQYAEVFGPLPPPGHGVNLLRWISS